MKSTEYKMWKAIVDLRTCFSCRTTHGKIYCADEQIDSKPPLHVRCRCEIEWLDVFFAGTATSKGVEGADWWIRNEGRLPGYYISWDDAKELGFRPALGNLDQVAPGKMVTRGVYRNKNGHLPSSTGRVWYEADVNYDYGYRGPARLLFSNDGMVFVTYDHYNTFAEII